ncbi:JmjC domain, hydroxylase-domain-containing protein [Dichotomocladium elegans]|nr:JmjC domain, hydroxylase-domain-containing protein [Dichotomocladium elegans]
MDEFSDFKKFMESIDPFGRQSGIAKIIPPKEWTAALPDIRPLLKHIRVRNPIIQHIIGSRGIYTQTNVEKRRPYTLGQWQSLCQQECHRPPGAGMDRKSRGIHPRARKQTMAPRLTTSADINERVQPPSANTRSKSSTDIPSPQTSPPRDKRQLAAEELSLAHSNLPAPVPEDIGCKDPEKYTIEYCKELERNYWRNLTFSQPLYGADMEGTLFDQSVRSWNVNSLDNMLNRLGVSLPGVNVPYLYFGMWKATFAWHVEDMDLYSINYLHFGAPKQWYAIPTTHTKKFEDVMQNLFAQEYKECPEFLRHKTFIVSPSVLANNSVPVHRCVQHEGEFIVTFPFGYHAGYNLGLNCAESVNFALDSWLEIGRRAKACTCITDSVMIDVSIFENSPTEKPKIQSREQTAPRGQRKRKRAYTYTEEEKGDRSCALCPNNDLCDEMLMTENELQRVHRICAEVIPEVALVGDNDARVAGLSKIPKARWKLVCQLCRQSIGACVQCCFGKCCRPFHPTCLQKAGHTMTRRPDNLWDVYCGQHDPKQVAERHKKRRLEHEETARQITVGRSVLVKYRFGGEYDATIVSNDNDRRVACVKFEDGSVRKVPWRDVVPK